MKPARRKSTKALQLYTPDAATLYTLEATERLGRVPRRMIIVYYKQGLVSPVIDPEFGGFYFNAEAIETLRRIDHLRAHYGMNLPAIKMILQLIDEVERLRVQARTKQR